MGTSFVRVRDGPSPWRRSRPWAVTRSARVTRGDLVYSRAVWRSRCCPQSPPLSEEWQVDSKGVLRTREWDYLTLLRQAVGNGDREV